MTTEAVEQVEHLDVPLDIIYPSKDNPRKTFDEKDQSELRESFKNVGQKEEIKLHKTDKGLEIVDGERRYKVATELDWKTIKAEVSGIDDFEAQNIRLIVLAMRKGVSDLEMETAVNSHYLDGRAKGIFVGDPRGGDKGFAEMHRQTGIAEMTINQYVSATQDRMLARKEIGDELTDRLSSRDFNAVRALKAGNEKLWVLLLKRRATREIKTQRELQEAVKTIKESPTDVAQAVAEGSLDTEYAKEIAKVDNPDERQKLVQSAIDIRKMQEEDEKRFKVQIQDMVEGDIDLTEDQREARLAALEHDQHTLRDLQKMYLDTKAVVRVEHILTVSTPEIMQECFKFVRKTLEIFESVASRAPQNDFKGDFLEVSYYEQ